MTSSKPHGGWLLAGAALSFAAALTHLICIVIGPEAYRWLGAGEEMARMAEAGLWQPAIVTAVIASMLFLAGCYALAGAGRIRRLPLLRTALGTITAVYLLRGFAFIPLMPLFPDNGPVFWAVSSLLCLLMGGVHLIGLVKGWSSLSPVDAGKGPALSSKA